MGDYNQHNQQVRRDQYNTEGNINQYRVRGYNQQGQHQYNAENNINQYQGDYHHYNNRNHYIENIGGDKFRGDKIVGNVGNKAGRDVIGKQYKVEGVKFIGYGILLYVILSFLSVVALIGGVAWFVSNNHISIPGWGSDPLKQELYGTPADALKQFCIHLGSGDSQGAYDVYSSHLKSQVSPDQFNTMWGGTDAGGCTSNITFSSDTSATGMIHTTHSGLANGSFVTTTTDYNVKLVTNDGIWQIDDVQKAS